MLAKTLAVRDAMEEALQQALYDLNVELNGARPGDAIRAHLLNDVPYGFQRPVDTPRPRWADMHDNEEPEMMQPSPWADMHDNEEPEMMQPSPWAGMQIDDEFAFPPAGAPASETANDIMDEVSVDDQTSMPKWTHQALHR
jgi:hypothetical protein